MTLNIAELRERRGLPPSATEPVVHLTHKEAQILLDAYEANQDVAGMLTNCAEISRKFPGHEQCAQTMDEIAARLRGTQEGGGDE